ncbi:MAG TPA: hypothetical protein PK228_21995, partial [Saprospiraceae bacterium]|nr:hypothetical protein [Saprospiraceae bacterium]
MDKTGSKGSDKTDLNTIRTSIFASKNMLNKLLPLFLILFQSDLTAQFVLIDSIEFDQKTLVYVISDERFGDHPLALTRGLIETDMPSDSINEVYVKNKYKIKLPYGSKLFYIDEKQLILSQLITGNPDLREPGKYREDRKTISKYTIDSAGTLTLANAVSIRMEDLPVGYDYALPSSSVIIT